MLKIVFAKSLATFALLSFASGTAFAQQFHLYLKCAGTLSSKAKPTKANLELAMRDNNLTALIQKSDVLPVGQRLNYVATEQAYSMQMSTPVYGTQGVYESWYGSLVFTWHPELKQLSMTRLSIDRQTGVLAGEMLNIAGKVLGKIRMACTPQSMDDVPTPRF